MPAPTDHDLIASRPAVAPAAQLLWTALVDIGPTQPLGTGPHGARFIVPILGGRVLGAPGFTGLSGVVLPGGADRQLLRADGVKELDALYEIHTDDGHTCTIRNRVIIDHDRQPQRYALSRVEVTAPQGPHDWLNRRVLVGTLDTARPEREAVIIRVWMLDTA
jgi:hypothetical protein